MINNLTKPVSTMQKFRMAYPRIDYYPGVQAHDAIQQLKRLNPGKSTRELVDALVCAGIQALSGKHRP